MVGKRVKSHFFSISWFVGRSCKIDKFCISLQVKLLHLFKTIRHVVIVSSYVARVDGGRGERIALWSLPSYADLSRDGLFHGEFSSVVVD